MAVSGFLELLRLTKQGNKRQQADDINRWSGIAFEMQHQTFVVPLGEVNEVLYCPDLTPIPNAAPWIKGLANVRGQLLTVIDLSEYFSGPIVKLTRQHKLLCLRYKDYYIGFIVDQVIGLQHFHTTSFVTLNKELKQDLQKYCHGYFKQKRVHWNVFLFSTLLKDFYQVKTILNK